jgi:hypothetical protein
MTPDPLRAQPQTRRSLDGLLAIGPHPLNAQLGALSAYAVRTGHSLDVLWALLPGEDPATDAPDSRFPIVAFDDEVAGFTAEEREPSASDDDSEGATTDWHVAHATPQPKSPTTHLPVYGYAGDRETAADAVLCVGSESLDRQLARIEAYAVRSGVRLRGVYIANDPDNLRVLLRDFSACNRALCAGALLTVDQRGEVEVHE